MYEHSALGKTRRIVIVQTPIVFAIHEHPFERIVSPDDPEWWGMLSWSVQHTLTRCYTE